MWNSLQEEVVTGLQLTSHNQSTGILLNINGYEDVHGESPKFCELKIAVRSTKNNMHHQQYAPLHFI
jgi:hypothetical protein